MADHRLDYFNYSRYEEFVKMSEKHVGELSGMVRLMVGFFVSQLFRRWWWQFEVRKYSYVEVVVIQRIIIHERFFKNFSFLSPANWQCRLHCPHAAWLCEPQRGSRGASGGSKALQTGYYKVHKPGHHRDTPHSFPEDSEEV